MQNNSVGLCNLGETTEWGKIENFHETKFHLSHTGTRLSSSMSSTTDERPEIGSKLKFVEEQLAAAAQRLPLAPRNGEKVF